MQWECDFFRQTERTVYEMKFLDKNWESNRSKTFHPLEQKFMVWTCLLHARRTNCVKDMRSEETGEKCKL